MAYRSRQSLSSPSPGGTEMDLLVMRERPRRGIRNSGYDVSSPSKKKLNVCWLYSFLEFHSNHQLMVNDKYFFFSTDTSV